MAQTISPNTENKIIRWLPVIFSGVVAVATLIGLYYNYRNKNVQDELAALDREIKSIQLKSLKQQQS